MLFLRKNKNLTKDSQINDENKFDYETIVN